MNRHNVVDQQFHDGNAIMKYAGSILLGLPIAFLCHFGHPHNELGFGLRVRDSVILVRLGQSLLEHAIFACHCGMLDKVVTEQQSIPVLEMMFNHVNVVRSVPV